MRAPLPLPDPFTGAWVLGPRIGRFDSSGRPREMPGHSATLTLLGVFILWFGWYGFNPGSANGIVGKAGVVATAAINTTISAAAGCLATLLVAMLHVWLHSRQVIWDLLVAGNGALAGLVSVTASCAGEWAGGGVNCSYCTTASFN